VYVGTSRSDLAKCSARVYHIARTGEYAGVSSEYPNTQSHAIRGHFTSICSL